MENFFSIYKHGEIQFLINDFIVEPDLCNFQCDYCLVEEASGCGNKKKYDFATIFSKDSNDAIFRNITSTLDKFSEIFKTPILRICGGELFYIKNMIEFIESICHKFEKIQIISNGYFLNTSILNRIKAMGNCILHISLDGHTQELNMRRLKNQKKHDQLMNHIHSIIELGIPLEIASCLTDRNTADYEKVVKYFHNIGGDVLLLPFPVRGKQSNIFQPSDDDKIKFQKLLSKYEQYRSVLPPFAYMQRLSDFYRHGRRTEACHIPRAIVQTFHNGDIAACCMDWSVKIGNIKEASLIEIENSMKKNKIYQLYSMDPPRIYACRFCFTISEIINLFIDNQISKEEIHGMHLFCGPQTRLMLDNIKSSVQQYNSTLSHRRNEANEYQ